MHLIYLVPGLRIRECIYYIIFTLQVFRFVKYNGSLLLLISYKLYSLSFKTRTRLRIKLKVEEFGGVVS